MFIKSTKKLKLIKIKKLFFKSKKKITIKDYKY